MLGAQQEDKIYESAEEDRNIDPLYIDTAQFEIKCEHLDLIENHASNQIDIEILLSDHVESGETAEIVTTVETSETDAKIIEVGATLEEKVDDDLSILIGKAGIPKPKAMRFNLVKHEDDLFSGNIPFDMTVSLLQ